MLHAFRERNEIINYSSWRLFRDIFVALRPYRGRFFLASFIRFLGDLAALVPAFSLAAMVTFLTQYKAGDPTTTVWVIIGVWFAATAFRHLAQYLMRLLGYRIADRVNLDTTLRVVQHFFRLDMAWHERENSGKKIKRIQNAGEAFNKIIRLWFDCLIEITVNLVAINIIIAQFDRGVLLMLLVFLVAYMTCSYVMTRRATAASYAVNQQEEEVSGLLFEAVNNMRTVKVMSMATTLFRMLSRGTDELFKRLKIRIFWYQSRTALLHFLAGSTRVGGVALIVYGVLQGHYEVGFLVLFNSYFSDLRMSIDELARASVDIAIAKVSIARMKNMMDEPITIDDNRGKTALSPDWKTISVRNLSFSYGDHDILRDISFDVHRGEKVGIIGLSGAGKSTLFKLLLKEREEFTGDILFDDHSIKDIQKEQYFQQVSVVLQDTEVFNFSLKENITITNAKQRSNAVLLKRAITISHLTEVIKKLSQGLETLIGEKGVKLSGGERQRLGIARAIFKDPELLLLDEATSHLDLESEEKIRDSLHAFFEDVTAIVIAHRLTTIREMDRILVLEEGRIIESGTFEELYQQKGRFHELWEKQRIVG